MANKCETTLWLCHDEPAQIERAIAAVLEDRLLQEFVPYEYGNDVDIPEEWWEEYWGCDSDIKNVHLIEEHVVEGRNYAWCRVYFETRRTPPIEFYSALKEQGFGVSALYMDEFGQWIGNWGDRGYLFTDEVTLHDEDEEEDDMSKVVEEDASKKSEA